MSIYAILAVDFYMNYGGDGFYVTNLNQTVPFKAFSEPFCTF